MYIVAGFPSLYSKHTIKPFSYLSVFLKIQLQRFHIVIKPQSLHGKQDVLSVDRLSFFLMASFTCSNKTLRLTKGNMYNVLKLRKHFVGLL